MVSIGQIFIFASLGKVICLQFCSFITENGWVSVNPANAVCFKYYNKATTWWDAKRSCEQQGLFLVRPDGESINEFMQKKRRDWKEPSFWIGGINKEDNGWKWTNGNEMEFTDFDSFTGTVNWIISFFKKSTFCAMHGYDTWYMKSCDELAPYLCQSEWNTTLTTVEPYVQLGQTRFSESSTKFCEPASRQGSLELNSTGTVCFVFFEERLSWWDANKRCHEHNISLVTISEISIDRKLQDVRDKLVIDFWIGAINKDNTGWKWVNGEDMVYTNFDSLVITWDRIFKQTLCGVRAVFSWVKQGCDNFYPFMCQFYSDSTTTRPQNPEIHEQTISANSTATPSKNAEIPEQATSASLSKAEAIGSKQHKQKIYKVKKVVGGRLNPKFIQSGQKTTLAMDLLHCCRLCSSEKGCELVNFCERSRSCVLYGNFNSAVRGGVMSELGCSIYVNVEKVD